METPQLHGVVETVPEFRYGTYEGNKLVRCTYEGHQRLIAAFWSKPEAETYKRDKESARNKATTGGYMQINECAYRMATKVEYKLTPVDVMPSVACSPS